MGVVYCQPALPDASIASADRADALLRIQHRAVIVWCESVSRSQLERSVEFMRPFLVSCVPLATGLTASVRIGRTGVPGLFLFLTFQVAAPSDCASAFWILAAPFRLTIRFHVTPLEIDRMFLPSDGNKIPHRLHVLICLQAAAH